MRAHGSWDSGLRARSFTDGNPTAPRPFGRLHKFTKWRWKVISCVANEAYQRGAGFLRLDWPSGCGSCISDPLNEYPTSQKLSVILITKRSDVPQPLEALLLTFTRRNYEPASFRSCWLCFSAFLASALALVSGLSAWIALRKLIGLPSVAAAHEDMSALV